MNLFKKGFIVTPYVLFLLWLLLFYDRRVMEATAINWIPFHSMIEWYNLATDHNWLRGTGWYFLTNLLGNVFLFLPFGWLTRLFFSKNLKETILYTVIFSLMMESLQWLLSRGQADIDDILLNTIGSALGYAFANFYIFLSVRAKHKLRGSKNSL